MKRAQFLHRFHLFSLAKPKVDLPTENVAVNKQAAVLIPIFEKQHQLHVLFTLRASHLKHHAGQVSFPGGKVESGDKNLTATALREAHEEIGLTDDNIDILGQLHPYKTLTGFHVTPIVGFINKQQDYQIDTNEVAEVFSVPLNHFLNLNNHFTVISRINNKPHPVTFMPYQHYNIWGATAAMLKDLSQHLSVE